MKKLLSAAALVLGLGVTSAHAAPINVTYQSGGVFGSGNLQQTVKVHTPGVGHDGYVKAGLFHLTGDQGVGNFVAFCVDLAQYLGNPQQVELNPTLFTGTIRDNIAKLFDVALGGDTLAGAIDTSLEAAGLQVALWEVLYDSATGFDLTSGGFYISTNAAVKSQAETYLAGLPGASASNYTLTFYESDDHQDLVTVEPVPLPAAGVLLAFGIAGLGFAGRRKKS